MAITFGSVTQNQYKITFLERSHHYFSNDVIHLPGIADVHYFIEESANLTEGKNQALAGAIPFCSEYLGPRFEDKFRSASQMEGISKVICQCLPVIQGKVRLVCAIF